MAEALRQCVDGGIKRFIINVPPRYMKSICALVAFPAWILGRQPNAKQDDQVDATTMILEVCNMNIINRPKKLGNKKLESEGSVNLGVFSTRRGYPEYDRFFASGTCGVS